jgi:hypothetical protein
MVVEKAQWLGGMAVAHFRGLQRAGPLRRGKLKGKRSRKKCIVVPGDGDPCPRCGNPMQIREYAGLNEKEERRSSFYTRWFCCMNKACKTTLVMPARYKVV